MPNDLDPVQLLNALLRKDLSSFIQRCFATVAPGNPYKHNWHTDAIAHQLKRCAGRDHAAHHHDATAVAQIHFNLRGVPCLALGAPPGHAHPGRVLCRRSFRETRARLPESAGVSMVPGPFPSHPDRQGQGRARRLRDDQGRALHLCTVARQTLKCE